MFNRFISIHNSKLQSIIEGSQGGNSRKNMKLKPQRTLLAGWFTGSCSASFLIEPKAACLGMEPPTVGKALPHPLMIKTIPYRPAQSQLLSFQVTVGCVELTAKANKTAIILGQQNTEKNIIFMGISQ